MTRPSIPLRATLICLAVTQLLLGCSPGAAPAEAPATTPAVADTNVSDDMVSAEAIIAPRKQAVLSFPVAGRVEEVLVSEGAAVSAGQELARLGKQDYEQAILQAEASLASAEAQLAKVRAGARLEEITEAEAAVTLAKANAQALQAAVDMATGDLAAAKANLASAGDAVSVAQSSVTAAEAKYNSAQANLNKLLRGAGATEIAIAQAQVEQARNEQSALEQKRDSTFNVLAGLLEAARAGVRIAELQLEQLKAGPRTEDIAAARALVAQASGGVQAARAQVSQAQASRAEAQVAIQISEAQLAQAQAQLEGGLKQVAQAEARRDLVKAGSRAEDVAIAEAAVAQAESALAEATNALEDSVIRAPFDGTVGRILLAEGETALPQAPAFYLGDLTQLRAETEDLGEADVDRVRPGQPARITVDALDGQVFDAKVLRIAPVATDRRGDKVYVVTLELDAGPDAGLRWGMSAFAEIDVQ